MEGNTSTTQPETPSTNSAPVDNVASGASAAPHPSPDSATPLPRPASERNDNRPSPKRTNLRPKIAVIILALLALALALIGLIIYFALRTTGVISSPDDNKTGTSADLGVNIDEITGETPEQTTYLRLSAKINALKNIDEPGSVTYADLEDDINNFIDEMAEEYEDTAAQVIAARILLADYYYAAGRGDLGVKYLSNAIANIDVEDTEGGYTAVAEYLISIFGYYNSVDDLDGQIETLEAILALPQDEVAILAYRNWKALREDYVILLEDLKNRPPEGEE